MQLKKLRLFNYCSYSDRTFTFDKGVTVITGANGKGKSSLLNAIFFCWTGSSLIEKKTRPKMLKWGTKSGYVESVAELNGIEYTVKRNLHTGSARMEWKEGGDCKLLTTTPEINSKMEELLHTDADTLSLSCFMPQKGALALIFGTDIERQKEYSRLFKLAHLQKHRETLREIYNGIEVYPDFAEDIKRLTTLLEGLKFEESTLRSGIETVEREIAEKTPLYEKARQPSEKPSEMEYKLYSRMLQAEELSKEVEGLQDYFTTASLQDKPEWGKDKEREDANNDFRELNRKIKLARQKLCPTCSSNVSVPEEVLTQMVVDETALRDKLDRLSKEWSKYQADADAYQRTSNEYQRKMDRAVSVTKVLSEIAVETEGFDKDAFLVKCQTAEPTKEQKTTISEYDALLKSLRSLQDKLTVSSTSIKLYEKQRKEKEGYMELRKLAEKQRAFLDEMRRIIHVDVFPKEVISEYRPRLSKLVNKYLSIFRQPFYADINADLACVCKFADNPTATVDDLSGGQGVLLTICFRMAIVELLSGSTNIIVLDEPTPHLDSDNRAILADAFVKVKQYLSTHGIQMLVSTHEMELLSVADGEIRI